MDAILINGIAAEYLSARDRGLHYGDGIFETIACLEGRPVFIEQHLQRMQQAAHRLGIGFPNRTLFFDDIGRLLADTGGHCVIKLILTRGQGQRGYRCQAKQTPTRLSMRSAWPAYIDAWRHDGVTAKFCKIPVSVNPHLGGLKTLNRLEYVLASNELDPETAEGLMLDPDGNVIEGTMSNVFGVFGDTLVTPDLSRCGIKGIMREQILDIAGTAGIKLEVRNMSRDELTRADEIFISNSVVGLCRVQQLEQVSYSENTMSQNIQTILDKRIHTDAKVAA